MIINYGILITEFKMPGLDGGMLIKKLNKSI